MTAETPTPLTDAVCRKLSDGTFIPACTGGAARGPDYCTCNIPTYKQLERRCAELERENAEVMLSDQGRLRSKLASYENQIAELRRDRERLLDVIDTITAVMGLTPVMANKAAFQEAYDFGRAVIRGSQTANGEGEL